MDSSEILIIGAGPSGLMAAQKLAELGYKVEIFEQNKAAARKFLVAGHGGFNLTHSEDINIFKTRYDAVEIQKIVANWDNKQTVEWLKAIGIETFVGSSGKIFPIKSIKPIQVLQAWLAQLEKLGVIIHYEHRLLDFDNNSITIEHPSGVKTVNFKNLILGLGGGSWQKTGSNAKWTSLFEKKFIRVNQLEAANSGYNTTFNFNMLEGEILKNVEVRFQNIRKKGELVFTNYGIEGSSVYYLNRFTRKTTFPYHIYIDLKPNMYEDSILNELSEANRITDCLKKDLNLSKTALSLLKLIKKEDFTNTETLAHIIKNYPIEVNSFRPIDEVISTAGGVAFTELNEDLSLKKFSNIYCLGEMLDWEAPTGGYLLQACFSMGQHVATEINARGKL